MSCIDPENLKKRSKVQFIAIRSDVLSLLKEGYTRKSLYEELSKKGVFTYSYRTFCEYLSVPRKKKNTLIVEQCPAPALDELVDRIPERKFQHTLPKSNELN